MSKDIFRNGSNISLQLTKICYFSKFGGIAQKLRLPHPFSFWDVFAYKSVNIGYKIDLKSDFDSLEYNLKEYINKIAFI